MYSPRGTRTMFHYGILLSLRLWSDTIPVIDYTFNKRLFLLEAQKCSLIKPLYVIYLYFL